MISKLNPAVAVSHRSIHGQLVSPASLIRELGLEHAGQLVLLDSAGGSPNLCGYSFLAWDPRLTLSVKGSVAQLSGPALASATGDSPVTARSNGASTDAAAVEMPVDDPFQLVRELLAVLKPDEPVAAVDVGLPLAGGALGMVSYDGGRYIERLPSLAADDLGLPEIGLIFPRKLICFDHDRSLAHILFEDPEPGELQRAADAIGRQQQLSLPQVPASIGRHAFSLSSATRSNMTRQSFKHMVRRAKEYILAGDIFQSNLSQRLELDYEGEGLDLYDALRLVNPSPFAGYLDFGPYRLISSSPERLVQLDGRRVQTRPIAGTRRRGVDVSEDDDLTQELNLDPKERAEHIMLVDLERNDMGRVCDYGSVHVDELMVNEAYSHVIHIVSNVRGLLHRSKDALDLLKAMFPGGTITGCPKVRCMEIIDELEPVRRGPYTGSFGYIGHNGNMDMNIIIRTLVQMEDRVYAQAGAGIVADSDPEREYRESLRKAEAMVRAVQLATSRASDRGFRVSG